MLDTADETDDRRGKDWTGRQRASSVVGRERRVIRVEKSTAMLQATKSRVRSAEVDE